jgi:hypothetical protein
MSSQRILGLVMLVAGVVLFLFGLNATDAVTEEVREGLTGKFSDKTTWYIIGGAALAVVGFMLSAVGGRRAAH